MRQDIVGSVRPPVAGLTYSIDDAVGARRDPSLGQLRERLGGLLPPVHEDRMAGGLSAVADGAHGAEAVGALGVANGTGLREQTVLVRFVDGRGAGEDERRVEPIEPQHVAVALVAVLVPQPVGRQDEVAWAHRQLLALDRGRRALAFDDEAERGRRVAVRSRHLAGPHELDGGVDGVGGAKRFGDARIDQRNRPPLAGTLDVDEVARLRNEPAHHVPAPQVRADAGAPCGPSATGPRRCDAPSRCTGLRDALPRRPARLSRYSSLAAPWAAGPMLNV